MGFQKAIGFLSVSLGIAVFASISKANAVGPSLAAQPIGIHGANRVGVATGRPFLYLIPASGHAPLVYAAKGLPDGLTLDRKTGIISGLSTKQGIYNASVVVRDHDGYAFKRIQFVVDDKAVALTPIMGWNPWYVWGCNIDDAKIRQAADLLVSTGLAAHGYNYINIDDCWAGARNPKGEMVPNSRFPDMKALADYVHAKGLRIGIYTSPGAFTCAHYPGSLGHIEQDVQTYADWGMDLIKYDWCGAKADEASVYQEMSDILARSSRSIVHMMCQYGVMDVWAWGKNIGGNLWRTNNDLADTWASVLRNGFANLKIARYGGPGHWNDLDMLMVGKANWPKQLGQFDIPNLPPRESQLTLDEKYTHLSIWSLMASPLIFSGDLTQVDAQTLALLTNDEVLAINQDRLGKPAQRVLDENGTQVITRELADGSIVVGLFNLNAAPTAVHADFASVTRGAFIPARVHDVWTHQDIDHDRVAVQMMVPAHGVKLLRVSKI